ncbi:hypothetical protein LEN26_000516 [Aphanomyces euteiches]|nr:hypothetical protein AeMF1_010436 [Aphanomyces euteiches]KAH9163445.1 hypothetical protein LEN26_000516 [Aphanomyces euteiches]KAH9183059.1 hypothetical protein AeNC1_014964 [Aphanomyces euteiches]
MSSLTYLKVAASFDLLLLVFDYQDGVLHIHHPLRRVGYLAWDICPSSHARLCSSMLEIDAILSPWYKRHGTSRIRTFVRSTNAFRHNVVACHAAYDGNIAVLRALLEATTHKCAEANLIDWAACNGQLHVIEFLQEATDGRARCTPWAMDSAAKHGHVEVLKWLHHHRSEGCTTAAVREAARNGHLHVLQWLARHCICLWSDAMDLAAANGRLAVVEWLHESKRPCSTKAFIGAASNGHLKVVQWLDQHRSAYCTTDAMDGAAKNGHLDVVVWLHHNRREGCTTAAMDGAALRGHIQVLRWLATHRTEGFSKASTKTAKLNGQDNVVQVLRAHRKLAKPASCIVQ